MEVHVDDRRPNRLGSALTALGIVVAVATVAGAVMGTILLRGLTTDVSAALNVTGEALGSVRSTVEVADAVLDTTVEGVGTANDGLAEVAASTSDVAEVADDLARLTAAEIPDTIDAVRDALPPLIASAEVLDRTLRALSRLGLAYDPEVPLDESLRRIDRELAPLGAEIRAQSDALRRIGPRTERLGENLGALGENLTVVEERLADAEGLLSDYEQTTNRTRQTIAASADQLAVRSRLGYLLIGLAGLAGLAVGVALATLGRSLVRSAGPGEGA